MFESRIAVLSLDAFSDLLRYSQHYTQQLLSRPTPSQAEIRFLLWDDHPQVIEDYPRDPRGGSCLIWGTTDSCGRVGHVICANPPDSRVITAYFPAETEPDKWEDNYRRRT
jgi:hypothetical protein